MLPQMSPRLPSMAKTSPSPTCFIFFNQNGASMNATATNGRSSALRCGCVARHYLILLLHSFTFLQARIALLEGERRSFENIKVDLMRRIKMLEYALRVERFVPLLSSTASRALTRFPRAAQSNSHNPVLTHPSRSPPQRLLLCSLPPRRTRHLVTRKLAVPAPLVAKVSGSLFVPFSY